MPRADVVVIGAGLAGLVAAARLAEAGARVIVAAKGHASTHWGSGGLDVAAPIGAASPADGVARLAALDHHPYAQLAPDVTPAVAWLLDRLAATGLPYAGSMDAPIRRVPTALGGTRPAAIVPEAQAAALRPWGRDEVLIIAGPTGFKDFWPAAIANSLGREAVWAGSDRPAVVQGVSVDLPGLPQRNNLNALDLARRFEDARQRQRDLDLLAGAIDRAAAGRPGRVALPAIAGLDRHADAWADLRARLPLEPFEVPLVPPSIPGIRFWRAMRAHIRAAGGRLQVGEWVAQLHVEDGRIVAVELEAAARTQRIRTHGAVLATGGLAGGGLVATADGRIVEPLLDLPVEAPPFDAWLARDALDPAGHPIEAAGIRTTPSLRPADPSTGRPLIANLVVAGALLAGQRALRERCGDGVAVASGWRAAGELLAGAGSQGAVEPEPIAARTQL